MTSEQKNIEKQFNGLFMDLDLTDEQAENISYLKRYVLEALRQYGVISRFNSYTFIDNVCLSYRHDFGLMAEQDKQRLRFECKEWMRAISNNWEYFKNGL